MYDVLRAQGSTAAEQASESAGVSVSRPSASPAYLQASFAPASTLLNKNDSFEPALQRNVSKPQVDCRSYKHTASRIRSEELSSVLDPSIDQHDSRALEHSSTGVHQPLVLYPSPPPHEADTRHGQLSGRFPYSPGLQPGLSLNSQEYSRPSSNGQPPPHTFLSQPQLTMPAVHGKAHQMSPAPESQGDSAALQRAGSQPCVTGQSRPEPPMAAGAGSPGGAPRRARRGSVLDLLGLGGLATQLTSGPSAVPKSAKSASQVAKLDQEGLQGEEGARAFRKAASQGMLGGREAGQQGPGEPVPERLVPRLRRRASLLSLFSPSQELLDTQGSGLLSPQPSEEPGAAGRPGGRPRARGRRASVVDLFTRRTGDMDGLDTGPGPPPPGSKGGKSRRASMIDLLNQGGKMALALLRGEGQDGAAEQEAAEEAAGPVWFTSLDDFKPIGFMYYRGRHMCTYFACSKKHSEHYLMKKYLRDLMEVGDERAVRRALAFSQELKHETLVKVCGSWESDEALYVVEEYASKSDLLQDSMAHPERYTEPFMAQQVVRPLLQLLEYLHANRVIHRSLFPENLYWGRDDRLRVGAYRSLVDMKVDTPRERIAFLDWMAPEMLSLRDEDQLLSSQVRPPAAAADPFSPEHRRALRAAAGAAAALRPAISAASTCDSARLGAQQGATDPPPCSQGPAPSRASLLHFALPGSPGQDEVGGEGEGEGGPGAGSGLMASLAGLNRALGKSFTQLSRRRPAPPPPPPQAPHTQGGLQQQGGHLGAEGGSAGPMPADSSAMPAAATPLWPPPSPLAPPPHPPPSITRTKSFATPPQRPSSSTPTSPFLRAASFFGGMASQAALLARPPRAPLLKSGACSPVAMRPRAGSVAVYPSADPPGGEALEEEEGPMRPGQGRSASMLWPLPAQPPLPYPHPALPTVGSAAGGGAGGQGGARASSPGGMAMAPKRLAALRSRQLSRRASGMSESEPGVPLPGDKLGRAAGGEGWGVLGQRLGSVIGGEGQQAGGSLSGRASQGGGLGGAATHLVVPHNAWEWREQYDEKVDIWQVGCLVHELLCGCLPFETEDKLLSSALILWADLVALPDTLSPQCMAFMQACLTKDPAQRPSASQLLQHEWLVRLGAGETLPSCRQLQEAANPSLVPHSLADILRQARQGAGGSSQRGWRPLSAWLAGLGGWLWGGGRGGAAGGPGGEEGSKAAAGAAAVKAEGVPALAVPAEAYQRALRRGAAGGCLRPPPPPPEADSSLV